MLRTNLRKQTIRNYSGWVIATLTLWGFLIPPSVMAQLLTHPFEITGVLTTVDPTPIPSPGVFPGTTQVQQAALGTITVNGIVIPVAAPDGINAPETISSPTKTALTLSQLSTVILPGRTQAGFLGGTVTAAGKMTIDTGPLTGGGKVKLIIVNNVQVAPGAEYVVLASVSEAICSNVTCTAPGDFIKFGTKFPDSATVTFPLSLNSLGLDLKPLTDIRIPGTVTNHGFKTNLLNTGSNGDGVLIGSTAVAQGYYAGMTATTASKFYYWNLDILTAPLLNAAIPEVSITVAKARWLNKSSQCKYDVRGFVHDWKLVPASTVTLWRADTNGNKVLDTAAIASVSITDTGTFGRWDTSVTTTPSNTPPNTLTGTTGCPVKVLAEMTGNAAIKVVQPLTLRIDPLFDQFAQ